MTQQQQNQGSRQSAAAVFRDRANRLHRRGDALLVLAKLIEAHPMDMDKEELLWSLAVGMQFKND